MAETKRIRRTKEESLNNKIAKIDASIEMHMVKIKDLKKEKAKLEETLAAIEEEKAKEAMMELAKLLKEKEMTVEDLKSLIS